MRDLLLRFLLLGCSSFGGPAAHLGYFRTAFVERLRWLDDATFARMVALAQFLPGPASSQVGFSIGLHRGGLAGGVAAFVAFTLPSFLLMGGLAVTSRAVVESPAFVGAIHGLKWLAAVVVADAVAKMFVAFCRGPVAIALGVAAAAAMLLRPGASTQFLVLGAAALVGAFALPRPAPADGAADARPRLLPLVLFALLLAGAPFLAAGNAWWALFDDFYRVGSFVFGGGHVVLPMLETAVGADVDPDRFLAGYAAAQAVPGPMFTLASFLGAELSPGSPLAGAAVATLAIFLPGFLLVLGLRGAWERLAGHPRLGRGAAGLNAAVVGLLLAALLGTVLPGAVGRPLEVVPVLAGLLLVRRTRLPILALVAGFAAAGAALGRWLT